VREHAEARRFDEALWRELCDLGWPGIAIDERYGGQSLGRVELSILCEELGRALAPVPLLASALASTIIEHGGSQEQRERWLPDLASGQAVGAVGVARDGVAELVVAAPVAQLFVLIEEGSARVISAEQVQVEPVDSIDSTRPAGRVCAPAGAGEALEGDVTGGVDRALVAIASELVGVCDRALEMTVAYVKERKQFGVPVGSYQAVSHRCAQMLLDTEKARSSAAFAAWAGGGDGEGGRLRCRHRGDGERDPSTRGDRLHLGGGRALALQAGAYRRGAARRREGAARATGEAPRVVVPRRAGRESPDGKTPHGRYPDC